MQRSLLLRDGSRLTVDCGRERCNRCALKYPEIADRTVGTQRHCAEFGLFPKSQVGYHILRLPGCRAAERRNKEAAANG